MKVLLSEKYTDYQSSLVYFNIPSLFERRQARVLDFCHRALKHPRHKQLFPISEQFANNIHNVRKQEKYSVNFAYTESYKKSFLPNAQRRLNEEYLKGRNNY